MEIDKIHLQKKEHYLRKIFCCIRSSHSPIKFNNSTTTDNMEDYRRRKKVNKKDTLKNRFNTKYDKSSLEIIEENGNGIHKEFYIQEDLDDDKKEDHSPPSFVASSLIHVWNDSVKQKESDELEATSTIPETEKDFYNNKLKNEHRNNSEKLLSNNKLENKHKNNSEKNLYSTKLDTKHKNNSEKNLKKKISFHEIKIFSDESADSCCTSDDDHEGFLGGLSLNSHEALNHIIRCFPFSSSKNNHSQRNKGNEYSVSVINTEENDKILRTHSVNDGKKNRTINNFKNKKVDFNKSDNFTYNHNETSWKDIKRHFSTSFNQVLHRKDSNTSMSRPSNLTLKDTNEIDKSISAPVTPSLNIMSNTTPAFLNFAKTKQNLPIKRNDSKSGNSNNSALSKLCQVSVDTMAITALPLDCWLKERLKSWVQLSGHEGTIIPASNHTLWKKQPSSNTIEAQAYQEIMKDPWLDGLTPKYYKEIFHKNESFIEIQDLLAQFSDTENRAIMDIKIGQRTFLESEVSNQKKRADLYKKMIDIDPNEPTPEEHEEGAITKLRYMQFRERESSTASLGFRIEAAKTSEGELKKNFKKIKTPEQIKETLLNFFEDYDTGKIRGQVLERLYEMRDRIEKSTFFKYHEVVGSSLLIVHDRNKVGVWMIDFAKSNQIDNGSTLDHRRPWKVGNHEDGYLVGIDNLIKIIESVDERNENIN
uniref:Kinase n=1 Tax=Strongyloides venezuelensis TaxID=75913 RepID=A0A0K0F509_STRVS